MTEPPWGLHLPSYLSVWPWSNFKLESWKCMLCFLDNRVQLCMILTCININVNIMMNIVIEVTLILLSMYYIQGRQLTRFPPWQKTECWCFLGCSWVKFVKFLMMITSVAFMPVSATFAPFSRWSSFKEKNRILPVSDSTEHLLFLLSHFFSPEIHWKIMLTLQVFDATPTKKTSNRLRISRIYARVIVLLGTVSDRVRDNICVWL